MRADRKKGLSVILTAVVLLCALSNFWQRQRILGESFSAPGDFAELGNYQAHYDLKGQGETALVMLAGSGTPSAYTDFYGLQDAFSSDFTTLSFDRAGMGWSEETDAQRDIDTLARELDALLTQTVGDQPVLLLAHSLGGLEAIRYAQLFPEKAEGLIFLDSGSPEFYVGDSEALAKLQNRVTAFFRELGVIRLLSARPSLLPLYGYDVRNPALPETLRELDAAMLNRHAGSPTTFAYVDCMNENAQRICEGSRLGDLPMLVLSSNGGKAWLNTQKELAAWSAQSRQVTLTKSGHYLHWTNEAEVIRQISAFYGEGMQKS